MHLGGNICIPGIGIGPLQDLHVKEGTVHILSMCCMFVKGRKEKNVFLESVGRFILL